MGRGHFAVVLLVAVAVLTSAPAARAQDSGYPGTTLPGGGAAATGPYRCAADTALGPSGFAYGRLDCPPTGASGSSSPDRLCTSPYRGYSGLLYSDHPPFYAPGGEAYSYAGYGSSYSPYPASTGASPPAGSVSAEVVAVSTSSGGCTSQSSSPVTSGTQSARFSRLDLASLALPSPTSIQRGTDLRAPDVWLIQTREGPVVQRVQPDGRRVFTPAPETAGDGPTIWRPWGALDRPAVEYAWQNFAIWWTDQGRAWPPD
jgi:hypothetical protein